MIIASKATQPLNGSAPFTDGLTTLGLVVGWALIAVGLLFWILAITN